MWRLLTTTLATLLCVLAVTGCGSTRLVDTTVSSFQGPNTLAAAANSPLGTAKRYWLERLPSQTTTQDVRMAAMAAQALAGVGLQAAPNRQNAEVLVTLTTSQAQHDHAPFEDPAPRTGLWFGTAGSGISLQFGTPTSNWYQRYLQWVFRAPNGDIWLEIKASHDGRWSDDDTVWQAMLNASLSNFPNPSAQPRVIHSDIPR